ncbi:MAG: preprotein translocase subunit SecA [Candidatus Palauibacterales bacterium]|nr:preprotein translocase subunit SecA [Candidatus Palauibacterales bacterium]MDP2529866.1 preprotein translocase subunit SecA [Candidatus Palauibacterales bacterium]MDP2584724.1 preprotein translocase subunit SecA [Candidatus Palauibacterales bacterium]
MLKSLINSLVGTRFEREMKKLQPIVDEIKRHESRLGDVSEEQIRAQTARFQEQIRERTAALEEEGSDLRERRRHSEDPGERADLTQRIAELDEELGELTQEVLDEILPEAFATVREACRRLLGREIHVTGNTMTWDMVPYDVQLIGGIVLHQGKIAEMATGEGKTLVATMPLYLNALAGKGAHLVTVNDYLARRDSQWMGAVFEYLGLTVGCIDDAEPGTQARRDAYGCDITYGTNNEFGFDYLRDNMVVRLEDRVQRGHAYAIIDEVDSVLIDEARTPLIISGPVGKDDQGIYHKYNNQVADLVRRQGRIVRELVAEGEKLLEESREEDDSAREHEAGQLLLAAQRGDPKNRRLMKLLNETGVKQLVQRTEGDLMREKRLHEIDELLLYSTDEKGHTIQISDQGLDVLSPSDPEAFVVPDLSQRVKKVEDSEDLSASDKREAVEALEREYAEKSEKIHIIHQLVKAHALYEKDVEYVEEGGQIVIVDEFTGRKMPGRRWSDGLHQAVEAKEGVTVQGETQTLATITIQNYFRMYDKLAGMTGTAETEEGEFHEIYGLEVVVIPTNRPVRRVDQEDVIFRTKREKYASLLEEIERLHERGLPILVGTTSVEVSEMIARMLRRRGLQHEVLNAKNHQREAQIVANAGQPGAITIATNMAGRGTDIKLGLGVVKCEVCGILSEEPAFGQVEETPDLSPAQIEELGCQIDPPCGLQILGTERHEARRIDRQLRGRSGRQGDPGSSRFFVSLEDDLMRLFGSDRIAKWLDRAGMKEGEVISDPWMTKALERAQKRVELQNFEARKKLLEYDDVMNQQREVIYDLRLFALEGGEDLKGEAWEMIESALRGDVADFVEEGSHPDRWDLAGLREKLVLDYFLLVDILPEGEVSPADLPWSDPEDVLEAVVEHAHEAYRRKIESFAEHWERILSFIVLSVIDDKWKDHLYELDHLRDSIRYRAWGQKDPLIEYKQEAFDEFVAMMTELRRAVANFLFRAQIEPEPRQRLRAPQITAMSGPDESPATGVGAPGGAGAGAEEPEPAFAATGVATSASADGSAAQMAPGGARVVRPDEPLDVHEEPGRNDPCPCGSGKKYKKCHGRLA